MEKIDFIILTILYFLIFYKKWQAKDKDVLLLNTTMYIYLTFVLYYTLMPIVASLPFLFNHGYKTMNFVPFIDVIIGRGDFIRQVELNILMTIPFGFLFPLVNKNKATFLNTIFSCFLLSLSIELLQPLLSPLRMSDITDLITNVLGGAIGYIIYYITLPLTTKILNYIKNI